MNFISLSKFTLYFWVKLYLFTFCSCLVYYFTNIHIFCANKNRLIPWCNCFAMSCSEHTDVDLFNLSATMHCEWMKDCSAYPPMRNIGMLIKYLYWSIATIIPNHSLKSMLIKKDSKFKINLFNFLHIITNSCQSMHNYNSLLWCLWYMLLWLFPLFVMAWAVKTWRAHKLLSALVVIKNAASIFMRSHLSFKFSSFCVLFILYCLIFYHASTKSSAY